ncbi:MAG: hypothetical protein JJ913_07855 [Rhizobiaceae bacterium]|nr:hypothetical protein [Rhizobiaceae bacterium]
MFHRFHVPILAIAAFVQAVPFVTQFSAQEFAQAESSRRVCTQQYDPVCGRKGTSYRTFGNSCEAQVSGYFVDHKGVCEFDRSQDRDPPVFCTREYKPVCATGGQGRKTFGNACEAQAAGYRIVHSGEC